MPKGVYKHVSKIQGFQKGHKLISGGERTWFKKGHSKYGPEHPNWKGGISYSRSTYLRRTALRPEPEQCEVCGAFGKDFKKGLFYDHNHKTGKFRGWICMRCNFTLGFVKDNTEILNSMINYLKNNN